VIKIIQTASPFDLRSCSLEAIDILLKCFIVKIHIGSCYYANFNQAMQTIDITASRMLLGLCRKDTGEDVFFSRKHQIYFSANGVTRASYSFPPNILDEISGNVRIEIPLSLVKEIEDNLTVSGWSNDILFDLREAIRTFNLVI
jgi:hypothetical protein